MSRWATPRCETRQGASHRRRDVPCQDASGWLIAQDRQGRPITILAVSDGHGAAQHPHSATGSRLACEIALGEAAQHLHQWDTAQLSAAAWRDWLSQDLPEKVVTRWRRGVAEHWTTGLGQPLASFSPIPYGATLGLLVLTPGGWGHTGLGDWDLLELSAEHGARIISQEPWHEGDAEATQSLCLVGAETCFAARSDWRPLRQSAAPFRLVLSSDGLRKSCGCDADYYTLAEFLCQLSSGEPDQGELGTQRSDALMPETMPQGHAADQLAPTVPVAPWSEELAERCLAAALDRISSQGSGDDISVAIAAWGQASDDEPGLAAPADADAGSGRGAGPQLGAWIIQPPSPGRREPLVLPATAQLEDRGAAMTPGGLAATGVRSRARAGAGPDPSRSASRPTVVWLGAALLGLGFGLLALLHPAARTPFPRPPSPRQPSPDPWPKQPPPTRPPLPESFGSRPDVDSESLPATQEQALRRVVAELCDRPANRRDRPANAGLESGLTELFSARKASFERLRRQPASQAAEALAGYATDPLGALIAWSDQASTAPGVARRRLRRLGACEALVRVLDQRWRATPSPSPSPPSQAPSRAPAGRLP